MMTGSAIYSTARNGIVNAFVSPRGRESGSPGPDFESMVNAILLVLIVIAVIIYSKR